MKAPREDLERRRPVWEAMSALFLDTELDAAHREEIVGVLHASKYSQAELDRILWGEVCPVLYANLLSTAGVWDGFEMGQVERQVLDRPAGAVRRWWSYVAGGRLAQRQWRALKADLAGRRAT